MGIELANGISYEFDGALVSANDKTVVIDCRVWPPLVAGEAAKVELSAPTALMPLPKILNPCHINGQLGGIELWLDDVWYRRMPQDRLPRRRAGLASIVLTHIGKLRMTTQFNKPSENAQPRSNKRSIKFYLTNNAFLAEHDWFFALITKPNDQTDELYAIVIPQLGRVRILREWVFARSADPNNAVVKSGFCAVVELDNEATQTTEEYLAHFEDALMVISIFCRQRVAVLGWEVKYADRQEQVWKNPLEPITTKYLPYEPHDYLVDKHSFETLTNVATKEWAALDPTMKDIFKHMSVGLAPFMNLQTSERFILMFQALEACRALAPEYGNAQDKTNDDALLLALEAAKRGADVGVVERIEGFIKTVKKGRLSLLQRLEWVLMHRGVNRDDLWPLSGPDNLPGLKQVRDKLAHSGQKALHPQGLAVATWHLSVLLERVLLALLKVSLADTSAAPNRLMREAWYKPAYLLEQRKLVIRSI